MKITTKLKGPVYLAEIGQSMRMQLALLKPIGDDFERITPPVLCRDFLCDVFTFSKAKQDFGIYGMSFKGTTDEPHYKKVLLQAWFPNAEAEKNFHTHLPLLHDVEARNHFLTTEIQKSETGETVIIGSGEWLQNCLKFSLYTFLLRTMCYPFEASPNWVVAFGDSSNTSDGKYAKSIAPDTWQKVLANLDTITTDSFCGFEVNANNLHMIHHNSGFISVFGLHTEINPKSVRKNRHWEIMNERGFTLATK